MDNQATTQPVSLITTMLYKEVGGTEMRRFNSSTLVVKLEPNMLRYAEQS